MRLFRYSLLVSTGWCGEIRDVIFSDNGSVTVVYRVTVRGSDGEVGLFLYNMHTCDLHILPFVCCASLQHKYAVPSINMGFHTLVHFLS